MNTKKIQDNLYQIRECARESSSHIGHNDPELLWEMLTQIENSVCIIRLELEDCKIEKTLSIKKQLERLKRLKEENNDES